MYPVFKRALAFLLALSLCISVLPMGALAGSVETEPVTVVETEEAVENTTVESTTAATEETTQPPCTETEPTAAEITAESELPQTEPVISVTEAQAESAQTVALEVETLPAKTVYRMGETIDLTGLTLRAEDSDGNTASVTLDDGITLVSGSTDASGRSTVTVGYGGLTASFTIGVHAVKVEDVLKASSKTVDLSLSGSYQPSFTVRKTLTWSGAQSLRIAFSSTIRVSGVSDGFNLYDRQGNKVGSYPGDSLAGQTVTIPGDRVTIEFYCYMGNSKQKILLDSVYACTETVIHESAGDDVHVDATCFTDGCDRYTCAICEETITQTQSGSAGHRYADGFCAACGLPEAVSYSGTLSSTVAWAITADSVLYICGTGTIPASAYNSITPKNTATALVVGSGITEIGTYAFYGQTNLKSLSLPGTVGTIGLNAFSGCTGLTSVSLASGIQELGGSMFYGCTALTAVEIPGSVKKIGGSAFSGCTALTDVTIPDSVTEIGGNAFYRCTALRHLYIPASVTTISAPSEGFGLFLYCNANLNIYCGAETLPEGWGEYWNCRMSYSSKEDEFLPADFGCTRATYEYWRTLDRTAESIVVPEGITIVPRRAFSAVTTLKSITLPGSVKHIGHSAFYACNYLTSVTLSQGLQTIGNEAFSGCSRLETLTLPEGITSIGHTFLDNSAVKEITLPSTLTHCGYSGKEGLFGGGNVTTVTFAEGTKKVPDYALCGQGWLISHSIRTVNLPDSLDAIGNYAFYGCDLMESFDLPDEIRSIGDYAFYCCDKLSSINLPAQLRSIGSNAFTGCENITAFRFPDKLETIGDYAFYSTGISKANLPASVRSLGSYAFLECQKLTSVTLHEGLETLGACIFKDCPELTKLELTIPSTVRTVVPDGFRGPLDSSVIKTVTFASGITEIPAYILSNEGTNSKVKTVTFGDPDSITAIGEYAFRNCVALTDFALPKNLKVLPTGVFYNCNSLQNVTIPEGVTIIGASAYASCDFLLTLDIPATVTTIADSAFDSCIRLWEITILPGQTVGQYAFNNCSGASRLTIGDNAVIGPYAFSGCTGLKEIIIGKNVTFAENAFGNLVLSGSCGDNLNWSMNMNSGLMTLSGSGHMTDYSAEEPAPWHSYASLISRFEFNGAIKSVGAYAFAGAENLRSVILPENIESIGVSAFAGCVNLRYVELSAGLLELGENAFDGCPALETVIFLGDAPILGTNCFGTSGPEILYPQSAEGFTARIQSRYPNCVWTVWDDSVQSRDIVILMDTSKAMADQSTALKQAVSRLTDALGGAEKRTRIALAGFDNDPLLACKFTTDPYVLQDSLTEILGGLGTSSYCYYASALDLAESVLLDSTADSRTVILLGGSTPSDGQNSWLPAADSLREDAALYVVGVNPSDALRQQLTTMASWEERYYDLEELDDLISAISHTEFATATLSYMGEEYNLLREEAELSLLTECTADIRIRPGSYLVLAGTASIALRQDGHTLLTSESGDFLSISPGEYFTKGLPVEAVFLDEWGNKLGSIELKLTFREDYSVTYIYATDVIDPETGEPRVYLTASHAPGETITPPKDPERQGYLFRGWYASETCGGLEFFHPLNTTGQQGITGDITLYPMWKEDTDLLIMGVDNWQFLNSPSVFSSGKRGYHHFVMMDDYIELLTENTLGGWAQYDFTSGGKWGGSCYGMSATTILAKVGVLDVASIDSLCRKPAPEGCGLNGSYHCVHDARITLYNNGGFCYIENLINYYQARQGFNPTYAFHIERVLSQWNNSDVVEELIYKMETVQEPVLLAVDFIDGGLHAVVAFDLQEPSPGEYTFQIYDCSASATESFTVKATPGIVNKYIVDYSEWSARQKNRDIRFLYVQTASEIMQGPDLIGTYSGFNSDSAASRSYYLRTGYDSFTITDGTASAVIREGEKVSGDLTISCLGNISNDGFDPEYGFLLPALAEGGSYAITQSGSGELRTTFYSEDSADGFLAVHEADAPGTVTVAADGTLSSHYGSETEHSMQVTRNDMTTPWYVVSVTGSSTGLTLTPGAEAVAITSETETTVSVETSDFFSGSTLESVPVGAAPVQVEEGDNVSCVITRDGQTIASSGFGYSVVFMSQGGSSVDALEKVAPGSRIAAPADPVRPGYLFGGWFKDEACTDGWDFASDTVTENTILYALWNADPDYVKSVTFRLEGQADQIVYLPADSLIPADAAPTGANGEALQWHETSTFTDEPWNFESDRLVESTVLYGRASLCTVSFDTGIEQTVQPLEVRSGTAITAPAGLVNPAHTLWGWYTDPEFTEEWDFSRAVAGDMTLYARWLPNVLDANGADTGICILIPEPEAIVYNGKPLTPALIVRDSGKTLTLGTDYTLSYKNNTNACDQNDPAVKESKLPQILITGKGNYAGKGKLTRYFTILPMEMADLQVSVPGAVAVKPGDKLQTLKVSASTGLVTVSAASYTLRYFTDEALTQELPGLSAAGRYYIALEAKQKDGSYTGNFTGITGGFPVEAVSSDRLVSKAKIVQQKTVTACAEAPGEAEALRALITGITMGKTEFRTEGDHLDAFLAHFSVSAVDADGSRYGQQALGRILTTVGKKTLCISALPGNPTGYAGEKTLSVTVKGASLNKKDFTVTFDESGETVSLTAAYSGLSQVPAVITELEEGTDYTLVYLSGKTEVKSWQIRNAGSYTLELRGMGRYSGKLSFKFTIGRLDLAKAWAAGDLTLVTPGKVTYSPLGAKLPVTLALHTPWGGSMTLREGRDYTLKCSGNTTVTDKAAATVAGQGNFTGTLDKSAVPQLQYSIGPKALDRGEITITINSVTMKNGTLSGVKYTIWDSGKKVATNQFTGTVWDMGDGTAFLLVTGLDKLYTGSRGVAFHTNLTDVKKVAAVLPKDVRYYYTGSPIQPVPVITDAEGNDISHCFLITYGTNITAGSGTVTIAGRPDMGYCGEKTLKFTILPKWTRWIFG